MKNINCKHCVNLCKIIGKTYCKEYKTESLEELKIERKQLLDGSNDKRRLTIEKKIDFLEYGIN